MIKIKRDKVFNSISEGGKTVGMGCSNSNKKERDQERERERVNSSPLAMHIDNCESNEQTLDNGCTT